MILLYLSDYKYIILFDTETTGLDFEKERIIEIAYQVYMPVGYNKFKLIRSSDVFIRHPNMTVDDKFIDRTDANGNRLTIAQLTHITDKMLLDYGVDESVVAKDVYETFFRPDTLIMAYNLNFDLNMIKSLLRRHNYVVDLTSYDYLDLYTLYKDYNFYSWKKDESSRRLGHRLDAAVDKFDVDVKNTHRAIDDVMATWEVFKVFLERKYKMLPYINVFGYNPKYENELVKVEGITYFPQVRPKDVLFASLKKYKESKK